MRERKKGIQESRERNKEDTKTERERERDNEDTKKQRNKKE